MTEEGRKYLSDIMMAIGLIEEFTVDTPDFEKRKVLQKGS